MPRILARRRHTQRVLLQGIARQDGRAFTAYTGRPELSAHERPSMARVLEDGRPLSGPGNALHEDIRRLGGGRFSFWHDWVYFSPGDDSDACTNGRRYEVEYPISPRQAAARRVRAAVRSACSPPPSTVPPVSPGGYDADLLLRSWRRLGYAPAPGATILDFGCGAGERVSQLRARGLHALGCDIALSGPVDGSGRADLAPGILRPIALQPYRLPFDDESCDVVFSVTVLEHVMDYDAALAEIARVLKPGGISVHVFPSRWKPLETHVYVPFASVCQSPLWLYFWAQAGIRNEHQGDLTARQVADANARFLAQETNYLTQRQIRAHARRHFAECRFAEEATFKPDRYARFQTLGPLQSVWRRWVSETSARVLVLRQPRRPA